MAAKTAKPKFFTLTPATSPEVSPALAAAEIALAILKTTNCTSVVDLIRRLDGGDAVITAKVATLILDDAQMTLLEDEHEIVDLVRIGPTVFIAECDSCRKTIAVMAVPPRSCGVTTGCTGLVKKSTVAKKNPYVVETVEPLELF